MGLDADIQGVDIILRIACIGSTDVHTAINRAVCTQRMQFHTDRLNQLAALIVNCFQFTRSSHRNQLAVHCCKTAIGGGIQLEGICIFKVHHCSSFVGGAVYSEVIIHSIVVMAADTNLSHRQITVGHIGSSKAYAGITNQAHGNDYHIAGNVCLEQNRLFDAAREQVVAVAGLGNGAAMLQPAGELTNHQVDSVRCIVPTGKVGLDTQVQSINAVLIVACIGCANVQTTVNGAIISYGMNFYADRIDLAGAIVDCLEFAHISAGNQLAVHRCKAAVRSRIQAESIGIFKTSHIGGHILHNFLCYILHSEVIIHSIVIVTADTYIAQSQVCALRQCIGGGHLLAGIADQAQGNIHNVAVQLGIKTHRLLIAAGEQIVTNTGFRNDTVSVEACPALSKLTQNNINSVGCIFPKICAVLGEVGLNSQVQGIDLVLLIGRVACIDIQAAVNAIIAYRMNFHADSTDCPSVIFVNSLELTGISGGNQHSILHNEAAGAGGIQVKVFPCFGRTKVYHCCRCLGCKHLHSRKGKKHSNRKDRRYPSAR